MKVVNISSIDWANFSYDNSMALKSVGVDCEAYTQNPHGFDYIGKAKKWDDTLSQQLLEADYVQIFHSCAKALNQYINSKSKAKLIVYHAGTAYRREPETINHLFNGFVHKSVIALPEFSGLGCKNEQYLVGAIDTDRIVPSVKYVEHPMNVSHFPSSAEKKGTEKIIEMVKEIKRTNDFYFIHSTENVPYEKQLERMRECDIYIELFMPELWGKPYGSFGISALEAAAMGKVVITQNLNPDVYFNEYGFCRLFTADNEESFKEILFLLANTHPKDIKKLQEETRQWIVDNHSYKATGTRIVEKVLT